MTIWDALGEVVNDFDSAWTRFRYGNTNEINAKEAEKQRAFDAEQNRLARELETQNTQEVNKTNLAIANATNQLNRDVADKNLQFQRDTLDYNKALQQQIFEREDTSYQRTAQDMAAAGLNPLTMSGTNGSGSVVSVAPESDDFVAQGAVMEKNQNASLFPKYERFEKVAAGIESVINAVTGISNAMSNLNSGFASRDLLRSQKNATDADTALKLQTRGYSSPYLEKMAYYVPFDNEGNIVSPSKYQRATDNRDYYDPSRRYMLDSISSGRQFENDVRYNLFNNSTEWERNLTAFEKALNTNRFNSIADEVGKSANDLLKKFLKEL